MEDIESIKIPPSETGIKEKSIGWESYMEMTRKLPFGI